MLFEISHQGLSDGTVIIDKIEFEKRMRVCDGIPQPHHKGQPELVPSGSYDADRSPNSSRRSSSKAKNMAAHTHALCHVPRWTMRNDKNEHKNRHSSSHLYYFSSLDTMVSRLPRLPFGLSTLHPVVTIKQRNHVLDTCINTRCTHY